MQLTGGFKDLLPANVQQAIQDSQKKPVPSAKANPSNVMRPPKAQPEAPAKALKDDSMAQIAETATEQAEGNQQSAKPQADQADSYLEKLAKENGIDLETASVEQLQ